MQLRYEQLFQHLANQLKPIYWLSGDEPLLAQEARLAIRSAARQAGYLEQVFIPVEAGFSWQDFYQRYQTLSLFNNQRLFDLRLTTKLNKDSGTILQQIAQASATDTLLLVSSPKLDSATMNSAWYQAIAQSAVCISLWPLDTQQLNLWLQQRCQQAGLRLTPAAFKLLTEWVEGNLLAAIQTINKLQLLYANAQIDSPEIIALVEDEARFDIFKLVDSALQGEVKRCLRALASLKAEGIEPTLILWAISKELRTLAQMASQLEQGITFERLSQNLRILPKRKSLVQHCLRAATVSTWYKLLQQAAHTDRIIKGLEPGDCWQTLQQLLLDLALKKFSHDTLVITSAAL
jgi:DNA polymerase-3 subunit delta